MDDGMFGAGCEDGKEGPGAKLYLRLAGVDGAGDDRHSVANHIFDQIAVDAYTIFKKLIVEIEIIIHSEHVTALPQAVNRCVQFIYSPKHTATMHDVLIYLEFFLF